MRLVVLALCLVGCGSGTELSACHLDDLAAADTTGVTSVDCGAYARGSDLYTDASMVAAQKCVINAIARKQGFIVLYDANDSAGQAPSGLRAGYTGVVRGARLVLRSYAGQADPDDPTRMKFVTARACERLDATASCKPAVGVPCLECSGPDPGNIICRG